MPVTTVVDDDHCGTTAEDQERIDAWLDASEEELRFQEELRNVGEVTVSQEERYLLARSPSPDDITL